MKIILTGAQGTGKTTILNHYREKGMPVITEVVRNLAKQGININEAGDAKGQEAIFAEYCKQFAEMPEFISDRGLTDVTAYTMHLCDIGKLSPEYMELQASALDEFVHNHQDFIYFYFPIEFPVVDDGVRSMDEEFRQCIDNNILTLLQELDIPYVEVRGTVEERIAIIDKTIALESQHA